MKALQQFADSPLSGLLTPAPAKLRLCRIIMSPL
jgi:hypothetical protein